MLRDEFFKTIQSHFDSQLPFVAYRKPKGRVIKAVLQQDTRIHNVVDFTENGFVFAPFDAHEKGILFPTAYSQTITAEVDLIESDPFVGRLRPESTAYQEEYMDLVTKGITHIKAGKLNKVVVSRVEKRAIAADNTLVIFKRLLQKYQDAFVYVWYHPNIGLWLGATPETLCHVEGQRFKTMSLAGTQKREDTQPMRWGDKEVNEQQIVTDYIVANLHGIVTDIKVTPARTIKAGSLLHLQSKISGILPSGQLESVVGCLHPTPAICGFPKLEAKQFIDDHEPYDREFYAGFLGELNLKTAKTRNTNRRNVENNAYSTIKTSSELFVNLRCMQLKENQAYIYVGGGITKDSNPKLEWEETVHKTQTMRSVLD
jgi:isochorismate synthase